MTVSTHLLIAVMESLIQFCHLLDRGLARWPFRFCGQDECNDFYCIELEAVTMCLIPRVNIRHCPLFASKLWRLGQNWRCTRLPAHSDIAPGPKNDPGQRFDWSQLHQSWQTDKDSYDSAFVFMLALPAGGDGWIVPAI